MLNRHFSTFELSVLIMLAVALLGMVLAALLIRVPLMYNVRNLTVRWRTTLMTGLAFTMVVALVTVMLAFVNGMAKLTQSSGQPGNLIILAQGVTDETFSSLVHGDTVDVKNQPGILQRNNEPLCSRETYLVVNQPIAKPAPGRPPRRFLQVRGVENAELAGEVHGLSLAEGNWISKEGARKVSQKNNSQGPLPPASQPTGADTVSTGSTQGAAQVAADRGTKNNDSQKPAAAAAGEALDEIVIGEGIARQLWLDRPEEERDPQREPQRLKKDDIVRLGDHDCVIVGVLRSAGSTFDSELWVRNAVVQDRFRKETFTSMVLRTAGAAEAERLKEFFTKKYTKASLQALTESEYYSGLSQTSMTFLYASVIVAVIVACGGVMGIMNTMFAAISQRTKDIGVLRIIGFGRWQILSSFVLESMLIALLGGLLGLALGMACDGLTATSIVSSGPGGGKFVVLRLTVDRQIMAVGLLLSLVMGLVGGLFPALLTAVRLKPLEALK